MSNPHFDFGFFKPLLVLSALSIADIVVAEEVGREYCPADKIPSVEFFVQSTDTIVPFLVSVPKPFLDRWFHPQPGSVQDSILLDADIRGFAPWKGEDQEFHLGILVTEFIDLNELAQSRARLQTGAGIASETEYRIRPSQFARLDELEFEKGQAGFAASNIYVAQQGLETYDPNGVTDMIICTVDGVRPVSIYQHYIDVLLADLKLSYRRSHLDDWEILSSQARRFWDCATTF